MDGQMKTPRAVGLLVGLAIVSAVGFGLGCSPFIGTTAASFLRKARESDDPNIRYLAYSKLGSMGCYDRQEQKDEAVELLVENMKPGREPTATRAIICRTLGELRRPEAHEVLVKATEDPDPIVRCEAFRALGKVGTIEDAALLARLMTVDRNLDCRLAAIDGIGELHASDSRILGMLVDQMDHDDPSIRLASLRALRKLTKKDLGVVPEPWREFLAQGNKAQGPASDPGTRRASTER